MLLYLSLFHLSIQKTLILLDILRIILAFFQEYDDEEPLQIDEVHEALRGGHAFKKMPMEPGLDVTAEIYGD